MSLTRTSAAAGLFDLDLDSAGDSFDPDPGAIAGPPPAPRSYDEAELRAAEMEAERRGRAAGRAEAEESVLGERNRLLGRIDLALAELSAASQQAAARLHEPAARTLVAMLRAALPGLMERHAAEGTGWMLRRIGPVFRLAAGVRVAVSPEDAETAAAELAAMPEGEVRPRVEADPALEAGDVRVEWEGGGTTYLRTEALAAIDRIFADAGLVPEAADREG